MKRRETRLITLHGESGHMSLSEEDKKWIQTELRSSQAELRSALEEKIMDTETKLLTEFHKWASPIELRLHSHATAMRAIDLELESVKERVTKLEPKQ